MPPRLIPSIHLVRGVGFSKGVMKGVLLRQKQAGKSTWELSNGGLRPLSAIWAQSSAIVHFCGLFEPLSKGNFRRKMMTIVGNCGQVP